MTDADLDLLKADLAAHEDLRNTTAPEAARLYALPADPVFVVWRVGVSLAEIGEAIHWGELAALSATNLARLQVMAGYSGMGVDASLADRRQFFDVVFAGTAGAKTRTVLQALWRRPATRGERLFAIGAGTAEAPGTVLEGTPTAGHIVKALARP